MLKVVYDTNVIVREVLNRPKFGLPSHAVEVFLQDITKSARFVHPKERLTAALDAGDNHVLECAVAAEADYLVTGNTKHFPTPTFRRIKIVPPAAFAIYCLQLGGLKPPPLGGSFSNLSLSLGA